SSPTPASAGASSRARRSTCASSSSSITNATASSSSTRTRWSYSSSCSPNAWIPASCVARRTVMQSTHTPLGTLGVRRVPALLLLGELGGCAPRPALSPGLGANGGSVANLPETPSENLARLEQLNTERRAKESPTDYILGEATCSPCVRWASTISPSGYASRG